MSDILSLSLFLSIMSFILSIPSSFIVSFSSSSKSSF
nr:MAG TPA: hypothetical protein [Caudoviricetes sp.]